jgi:hypothetical protein
LLHLLIVEVASALPAFWGSIALQIDPDIRIFGYTLLVSLVSGVTFGLAPAWQASRSDLNAALKGVGRAFGRRLSRSRLRLPRAVDQFGAPAPRFRARAPRGAGV